MFDMKVWRKENVNHIREYNANWLKNNKDYKKKWNSNNPEYYIKRLKEKPWLKTIHSIRVRISKSKSYSSIKSYITPEQLKELWFRDKAYLMVKPSIDRIDTYGDYTFENCRYMEYIDNLKRPKRKSKGVI